MEPVTTGGTVAFLKVYGVWLAVVSALVFVATVVLMTRLPRSPQEFLVGVICTVVSSLMGGSFLIIYFGLQTWASHVWGVMVIGGLFFTAGLPGWALVRWVFNFIDAREGSTLLDIFREFNEEFRKGKK